MIKKGKKISEELNIAQIRKAINAALSTGLAEAAAGRKGTKQTGISKQLSEIIASFILHGDFSPI